MTVVGEKCVEEISDAGSIPASSIQKRAEPFFSYRAKGIEQGGRSEATEGEGPVDLRRRRGQKGARAPAGFPPAPYKKGQSPFFRIERRESNKEGGAKRRKEKVRWTFDADGARKARERRRDSRQLHTKKGRALFFVDVLN